MKSPLEGQETPIVKKIEQRDKVELSEMKDRLASIIKQISGKKETTVDTELSPEDIIASLYLGQDPADIWFAQEIKDPKTGKTKIFRVHIPKKIFETHEDVAKGKAAHEAGHVAITRTDFIPDKVIQELGFHHQYLAVEELPTDQVVRDRYAGAGRWVNTSRRDSVIKTESMNEIQGKLGYIPKSIQLNDLFVYGQHLEDIFGAIPDRIDDDVAELYNRLRIHLKTIENTLPPDGASEQEIIEKAKERYKINYKKIWPEVKKLVEKDLEIEKLRQMLQQAMQEQQQGEGKQEGQESQEQEGAEQKETEGSNKSGKGEKSMEDQIKEAVKSLGQEFQNELEKALKEFSEEHKKKSQEKKEKSQKEDSGETIEKSGQEQKDKTGKETKPERAETQTEETGEAEDEVPMRKPGEERPEGNPIPMDKLNQKLIEALEKAYNKLPEELKKALEEKARQVLKELEDQFTKELSPGLIKEGGETHEEYKKRVEEEKNEASEKELKALEKQITAEELKDIERRQASLLATREIYDKFYAGLRKLDERLYRELEEVFIPNIKRTIKLKSAGSKINLPAVFRWEASKKARAGQIDSKIFETVYLPEKKDYVFTLLNDLSGSMSGVKSIEDFKAKILLAEILNRLGIKNEILGFQDTVITFKKFDEELNDNVRKRMSGMLLEVKGRNPGGHNNPSENDDGPCLLEASKGLEAQPGREKFLVVISDGLPSGPYGMDIFLQIKKTPDEYLKEAVATILKNTNHKLIALGLGDDTEHVKDFYPVSFPNISAEQLSGILGDLLKDMILNPQKYSFKQE